jgi:hypothetical protein
MYGERDNGNEGFEERRKELHQVLKGAALRLLSTNPLGFHIDDPQLGIAIATKAALRPAPSAEAVHTRDQAALIAAAQELLQMEHIAAAALPLIDGTSLYLGRTDAVEQLMKPRDWIPYTGDD